jgi:hypothetical protein
MASHFDADLSETGLSDRIPPLWTLKDLEGTENPKLLEWLNRTYTTELKQIAKYREQCLKHVAMFRGKFYANDHGRSGFAEASQQGLGLQSQRPSKLVVNHLYDLTTQRVSRVTRNKPAITVNPANSEYRDKVSARIMKFWVDYLLYENDFDALVAELAQSTYIMGESYIASRWDPDAGEPFEAWANESAAARRERRAPRVEQRDAQGQVVLGDDGEPIYIEKEVKTGEVVLEVWTPLDTIVQRCGDFRKAAYWFHEEYLDIDEVRALYPDSKELVEADAEEDALSPLRTVAEIDIGPAAGKVLVRHFRHRPDRYLGSGRYIISTRTAILKNTALQPNETGLGLARLTDIDVPKRQYGLSFFEHGKRINAAVNDLTSMAMRNSKLMSHPKWVVPRGSVIKKDALGNDISIIEYQGAIEPRMVAPPPMNNELMSMRADIKQDLQMILGVFDISRGQVPPNIRSAMALQLIDEQEDQRANSSVAKHAALIRDVIVNSINVAASYYDREDKRLLPIVGKDNRYMVKEFDPTHLSKSYDVRVANSSGMPNSKAARTEMLLELGKIYPDAIPPQKLFELLQWGDTEGFYDETTAAVKAASAENEAMLNDEVDAAGEPVTEEPTIYEDLMIHWITHVNEVQNRSFKTSTPRNVQERFIAHIGATEMLMMERARKNPAFGLKLMEQPLFPLVFEPSPEDFMLLDRARTGNPMSLMEIDSLYKTGMLPPPGMGVPPPAGGINNGIQQVGPNAGIAPQTQEQPAAPEGAEVSPQGPVG